MFSAFIAGVHATQIINADRHASGDMLRSNFLQHCAHRLTGPYAILPYRRGCQYFTDNLIPDFRPAVLQT